MVEGILTEGAVLEFIQLQLVEKGGLVMLLIGVLSIIAAVIVIERLLYFRGRGADEEKLLKGLSDTLDKGLLDQAKGVCEQSHAPLAALISMGIAHIRERKVSAQELREFLLETASLEIPKEERFVSALGTIAHIAPLLGLLGTVTGNIRAFGVLGDLGAITDPALLSRGISEALLTTAAGIIVSIPAIIFYNFLVNKVNHRIIRLENRVSELASLLVAAADKAAGPAPVAIGNGNGAMHGAAAAEPFAAAASQAPARTAPAHAAPAAGHPGVFPVMAAAMSTPVESAPAWYEPVAPVHHPAPSPQVAQAPPMEAVPGRYAAAPAPSQFEAVPPRAATESTHYAQTVPTRVAAVPTHLEAVPAT